MSEWSQNRLAAYSRGGGGGGGGGGGPCAC
jgi:hypothetical protein